MNSAQLLTCTFLSLAIIALTVACSQKPPAEQTAISSKPFTPPAQPYKFDAEDGQWTMPAKNYSSTRFSGLSEMWGLALTLDGKKLYAANGLSNDVSVIDTATNAVTATVKAGDGPWGIAIVGF